MIGETTLDERVFEQLKRIEDVQKHMQTRFGTDLTEEDFVCQLIADATWFATYHGIDLETKIEEIVKDIRDRFPETC